MGIKWVKTNILEVLQVLPLVGAAMVGVLAVLQNVPWYLIALGVLAAPAVVFLGINQYTAFYERHKKGLTKLPDTGIETTIRNWVDIPAFKFQRQAPDNSVYFVFEVTFGNSSVHIERQRKDPLVIVLASELQMRPERTILTNVQWERLASQLAIEMARLGIQFEFRGSPNVWDTLRVIDTVILDDSMTGFYFRQRVMFVYRATFLASEVFKEYLRQMFETPIPDKEGSQS